jgi:hypothetical protein
MVCVDDTLHLIGLTSLAVTLLYFIGFKISMKHFLWHITASWCLALVTNVVMKATLPGVWPDDILSELVASVAFMGFFYYVLKMIQSLFLLITAVVMLTPVKAGAVSFAREVAFDLSGQVVEDWVCYVLLIFTALSILAVYVLLYRYQVIKMVTQGILLGGLFTLALRILYKGGLPFVTTSRALCCRFIASDLYFALTANTDNLKILSTQEDTQCVLRSETSWWLIFAAATLVQIIGQSSCLSTPKKVVTPTTPIQYTKIAPS